ncbi:MAG: PorV/PorQ family protein [Elusimicrobiota bacterium]
MCNPIRKVIKWLVNFKWLSGYVVRWFVFTIHLFTYSLIHLLLITYSLNHLITCLYSKGTGTTAGVTLLSANGVRQTALGGSGTSLSGDVYAIFYNPALLPDIPQKQLASSFALGLTDDSQAAVLYGLKKFAVGIFYLNGGRIEINYVDGTSRNVVAQSDCLATLGWGGYSSKNVALGYNLKYLSSKLVESYASEAIAFDMGLQLKSTNNRFRFGLAAQNFGTSLKYRSQKESLPFLVRSGISYNFPIRFAHPRINSGATHSLLFIFDSFYLFKENNLYNSAGLEYSIFEKYFLRAGCRFLPDRNSFTIGLGVSFAEKFSLDWSTEFAELNIPHKIAFTVKF